MSISAKDELAQVLADNLNKQFKDTKVAYFLDGSNATPTDIKEFISTGSSILDLAISNRPNGGIAVGRITEINGLESSGKSLIGTHILAETQKKGGLAVYIDTETSVSREWLETIGVDVPNLLYLHVETVEDVLKTLLLRLENQIEKG
jgi:recombination protein RecA